MTLEMRPQEKAAALVVAIGPQAAAGLLQFLNEDEVEQLAGEVARIGKLSPEAVEGVFEEVYYEAEAHRLLMSGGIDYARELLQDWRGAKGNEIIERLLADLNVMPFTFVRDIEADQFVRIMKDEHPQTVALILAHQPASYAAQVLSGFDAITQAEVAFRIANMGRTSPEVIDRVESALQARLGSVTGGDIQVRGGVEDLAEVLNNTDRSTERSILERLAEVDPALAETVRSLMFVFEDLVTLDDRTLQRLIQELDTKELAIAMKGVSGDLKDSILRNMSQRASEAVLEELELLGAIRRSDVESAQANVVGELRRLEDAGTIVINRSGEGDLVE